MEEEDTKKTSYPKQRDSKKYSVLKDEPKRVIIKFIPDEDVGAGPLSRTINTLQQCAADSDRKGPKTIVRTIDLNDGIEIKRRYGNSRSKDANQLLNNFAVYL